MLVIVTFELKKLCFTLCLKLHSSSFNVIIVSLNGSRKCKIEEIELVLRHSPYDHYADRLQIDKNLSNTNLLNFCSNFDWVNKKLKQRKLSVIVRTIPQFSFDPNGSNYGQFC